MHARAKGPRQREASYRALSQRPTPSGRLVACNAHFSVLPDTTSYGRLRNTRQLTASAGYASTAAPSPQQRLQKPHIRGPPQSTKAIQAGTRPQAITVSPHDDLRPSDAPGGSVSLTYGSTTALIARPVRALSIAASVSIKGNR